MIRTADLGNIGENDIRENIEDLIDYLGGPIIADDFSENDDRDLWEKAMSQIFAAADLNFYEFHLKNKLRANRITIALGVIEVLGNRFTPVIPQKLVDEEKRIRSIFQAVAKLTNSEGRIITRDLRPEQIDEATANRIVNEKLQLTEYEYYDSLCTEDKIKVVQDLDNLVRQVVEFVCQRRLENLYQG